MMYEWEGQRHALNSLDELYHLAQGFNVILIAQQESIAGWEEVVENGITIYTPVIVAGSIDS